MTPLLVVLPYCSKDLKSAQALLDWINELGGCDQHSCLLVADSAIDKNDRQSLHGSAKKCFYSTGTLPVMTKPVGFPPNRMFLAAAQHILQCYKSAWLWLEPDCVPLKAGWLDSLSVEYEKSTKRFMGALVESNQPGIPQTHLPGCSIYPPDAFTLYESIASLKTEMVAWDMEAAQSVVPRVRETRLIQHFWGKKELPPTFVERKQAGTEYAENTLDLKFLHPEAVLFHRNKDGTLIRCLRSAAEKVRTPESSSMLNRITSTLKSIPVSKVT